MRTGTWIFGIAVGVVSFHMYAKRADPGEKAGAPPARGGREISLATAADGPETSGGSTGQTPGAKKGQPTTPVGAPPRAPVAPPMAEVAAPASEGDVSTDGAAGALAATLYGQAVQVLESGDQARASLLLYRVARARTNAPERADAEKKLAEIERSALAKAVQSKAAGAIEEERAALSVAYLACLDATRRAPVKARLDELSADIVFSSRASGAASSHTVKPGESLVKVAATYNFPAEGIQRINRLKGAGLRIGERLKVPKGPVELFAVKSEFRLVALFNGLYAKEYACGLGKGGCTPEATFTIDTKIEKPTYFSRDGTFPFGHEKNILGTRWLGFKNTDEHKGFGIHGTAFPESIGKEASSGCVRLRNEDVEDLFGWVPKGTSVVIVR